MLRRHSIDFNGSGFGSMALAVLQIVRPGPVLAMDCVSFQLLHSNLSKLVALDCGRLLSTRRDGWSTLERMISKWSFLYTQIQLLD